MVTEKGIVFNIQRYSLHDGPGIRTIVFLKGCPLRCKWCSNPESQEIKPELGYIKSSCNKCNECIGICPQNAITATEDGIKIDRNKCDVCFKCVAACAPGSLKTEGQEMTVDEVVAEVLKDESFYRNSGGGVTLSGGEVLMQHLFAAAILKALKEKGINTAIETTGHADWGHFEKVLEYTDYVLYDLKHVYEDIHIQGTGAGNSLLIENLTKVAALDKKLIVRIPLIPGFNMDKDNIEKSITLLKRLNQKEVNILPFHQLGSQKYANYGKDYQLQNLKAPADIEVESIRLLFEKSGFNVTIGG